MAYIATQQVNKGMCKKTVRALRWLAFLSFALVTLVVLAQAEHQLKMEQDSYAAVSQDLNKSMMSSLSARQ